MFTSLLFLCLKKACTHSSMMELKKCLITVVLNVQNFGKCLSFNVSSVTGFDEGNLREKSLNFCSAQRLYDSNAVQFGDKWIN